MPQFLSSILIHLILTTKNRERFITPAIESELHPYMATILRAHKSPSLIIDGTLNHVHILFALGRDTTVANLVEEVKTGSSKWIKTKGREFRNFRWQRRFGAFSIGQSNVATLERYIRSQKEHHRRVTFEDKYRNLFKRFELQFDERYGSR
jgi:putative transposase